MVRVRWGRVVVERDALSSTKAEPNFPCQIKVKRLFIRFWCVRYRALLEERFKQRPSSRTPTERAERPSHALFGACCLLVAGHRREVWMAAAYLEYNLRLTRNRTLQPPHPIAT